MEGDFRLRGFVGQNGDTKIRKAQQTGQLEKILKNALREVD
jgi:hypothetical protein